MPIYMTAQWKCKPDSEEVVKKALREFVAAVKRNEPNTRVYTALQQADETTSFLTYFIFADQAAQAFHRSTDWVKRFTEVIYPENLEPVVFTEYELVASTDEI